MIRPHAIFKSLIALIIIMLTFQLGILSAAAAEMIGIITAKTLKLRSLPRQDASPIAMLKRGAEVKILVLQNDWLKISYGRQTGYVFNQQQAVHLIDLGTGPEQEKELPVNLPTGKSFVQLESESGVISRKIEKSESEVAKYTQKEVNLLIGLNKIDYTIDKHKKKIDYRRKELANLENKIEATRTAYKKLAQQIEINEEYAAERLIALYKLNHLGSVQFLASSGTFYEMIYRKKNLETILAYDQDNREKLQADKQQLKRVLGQLSDQQIRKHAAEKKVKNRLDQLSHKKSERSRLLADIRTKRSLEKAALASLKAAATVLDDTIASLNAQKTLADTSLQALDEQKGLLKMPVEGKIVTLFGSYKNRKFNVTNFRNGIDIEARKGASVEAVFTGNVLYADWFKGYGKMIIIDHGASYYTVYAHLEEMLKKKGESITTGERIATVGDSGSLYGPALYFEVRHHGKPLDPIDWIKARKTN